MGFQDRDYYRDESEQTFATSMVVKLIILNGLVFLADALFGGRDHAITKTLAVNGNTLLEPLYWWQFLTAGFAHDWKFLNHILFNMLGLYFFGKPLEERFGRFEFLRYYLVAVVVGMLLWGVRVYLESLSLPAVQQLDFRQQFLCFGASGGVTACIILFCLLYPRAAILLIVFPLPAWLVGILIVVQNILGTGANVAYDVHLFGAAFALAYWYFGWNFGRLPGMAGLGRWFATPQRWIKGQPNLRVHDPEPEQEYEDLDAEGDRILAKLHREGEGSLTTKERRVLEDYSRRMRQKRR